MNLVFPLYFAFFAAPLETGAAGGRDRERPPTDAAVPPADSGLREVFAAWEARDAAFDLSYRVERTSRSGSFGAFGAAAPVADATPVSRLRSDGVRVRFDGAGRPPIEIGGAPVGLAALFAKPTGSDAEYLEALWSGFERPTDPEPLQPHVVVRERDRVVHFWDRRGEAYPRALVLPAMALRERASAGRGEPGLPDDAGAALFALRPLSSPGPPRPERCVRSPEQSVLKGVSCVVVEETLRGEEPKRVRRFWLDPARGFVPLRALELEGNVARRHWEFEYDRPAGGNWVPSRWTVLNLHEYGGVDDFATVVRTAWNANAFPSREAFGPTYPPGTWVVDLDRGRQSLVETAGERRLDFAETAGDATYAGLLRGGTVSAPWPRTKRLLIALVSWPWVVATLPVLWVVVQATLAGVRRCSRRRATRRAASSETPAPVAAGGRGGDAP